MPWTYCTCMDLVSIPPSFSLLCCVYCVCLNTLKGLQRNKDKWQSGKSLWEQRKVFGAQIKNEVEGSITVRFEKTLGSGIFNFSLFFLLLTLWLFFWVLRLIFIVVCVSNLLSVLHFRCHLWHLPLNRHLRGHWLCDQVFCLIWSH